MRKITMVAGCQREHSQRIQSDAKKRGRKTNSDEKHAETRDMHKDERYELGRLLDPRVNASVGRYFFMRIIDFLTRIIGD